MRKIILDLAVSLDNYIEGPNGEYDWCFVDQDYGFTSLLNRIDSVFYGRKSFELFGSYNPATGATEMEKLFLKMMDEKKKYVFSNTLKSVENAVLINGNIEEKVKRIKEEPGKDIQLFGGAGLITALENLNLIDEYHIAVHPIILGAGKPLFKDIKERKKLTLLDTKIYPNGLVILIYKSQN
jgi:dihydrofolate reductase